MDHERNSDAPRVTAVIVTHNSTAIVDECVTSLKHAFPGVPLNTVVVDSGSTDGTPEHVRRTHPQATVIEMAQNRGFAAGINVGSAEAATDDVLLVLNPDVRLESRAGLELLDALSQRDRTGIVVPRLHDAMGQLQHSLRRDPSIGRAIGTAVLGGRFSGRFASLSDEVTGANRYEEAHFADWATGAVMAIGPECRASVGAWDESYFLYSEETDYCLRARAEGFEVMYAPKATAVHLGGESTTSPELWSILIRNKVVLYRRNHRILPSAAFWLATTIGEGGRALRGTGRSRAAFLELVSPRPRHEAVSAARHAAPGWVCFAGQDWWYHNHGHSDFQLMTRLGRHRTVLLVNSIGMRMPAPGRSPGFMRRIMRKALSISKGLRRPLPRRPRFLVLSPVILPFYGNQVARRVNSTLVRAQVRIVCRLLGIGVPVQVVTIPTAWDVVKPMRRRALVYNRSDKHSAFSEVDTQFVERLELELLSHSDAVVYVSHALMSEDAHIAEDRSHFLDHGVDLKHFTRRMRSEFPADIDQIPEPRIGFFGGIDDYVVDIELLEKTARRFPDASLLLIGDATCPVGELATLQNVYLLGARPYAEIPKYGSAFDVALMPWLQNEWINACNPIKAKEYLSLGLPTVSMWYPEVAQYEDVMLTCRSHDEFLEAIATILDGAPPASPDACRQAVISASWDSRVERLRAIVEGRH